MTTLVQPVARPGRQVAGTRRLAAAIARDLQRLYGRDGGLDEAGADRHLRFIVAQAKKDAAKAVDADLLSCTAGDTALLAAAARPKFRAGLVARVRRQIAVDSYECVQKLEGALCGLADELGV